MLGGFETAVEAAVKAQHDNPGDPLVMAAFSRGWQMSELYRLDVHGREDDDSGGLPGFSSLPGMVRLHIQVDQVKVGIGNLSRTVEKAGLPRISTDAVSTAAGMATDDRVDRKAAHAAEEGRDDGGGEARDTTPPPQATPPPIDSAELKAAVLDLHQTLIGSLTATDPRFGKAYGLGGGLCGACRKSNDDDHVLDEFETHKIADLRGCLDDLSSAFPAHAARSVSSSLSAWTEWTPDEAAKKSARALARRQGELWRAVLSGEKNAKDLLEIDDYLDAAAEAGRQAAKALRRAALRFWLLSLLVILLFGGGVALLVIGGVSKEIAGVTSLLTAVGLTWKGVGTTLGKLAGKLEAPLWGAVLDRAVTHAITLVQPQQPSESTLIPQSIQNRLDPWSNKTGIARTRLATQSDATRPERTPKEPRTENEDDLAVVAQPAGAEVSTS